MPTNNQESSEVLDLEHILCELPPLNRAVLELRTRESLSYDAIAKKLELSPEAVKECMRSALARCLEQRRVAAAQIQIN